jgi:hypothetical protein
MPSLGSSLRAHPLLSLIIFAILLRFVATVWSQGYFAHDDHFETVEIAWSWHQQGMFLDDGTLRWEGKPDIGVMRCIVYNLFLLGLMKITSAFGIATLNGHMYFDRLIHALLSLLPVIFGYRYLKEQTDERTAIWGGLLLAGHFLMPFLAVRNLVEMVAADLLFPSLYFAHRGLRNQSSRELVLAAIIAAIAIAVRLQVALAIAAVPIAMLIQDRKWRPALVFSAVLAIALCLLSISEIYTHGRFLGSVFNYVQGNLGAPPTIPGPWYRYLLLLLGVMIPPFSLIFLASLIQRRVIREHLLIWLPTMAFIVGHSLITNKQERFVIPILPELFVLGCVGLSLYWRESNWWQRKRRLVRGLVLSFVIINLILLIPFTLNFGKRGAVEPLVYLSRQTDAQHVVFDMTERNLFIPFSYWNYDRSGAIVLASTGDLDSALARGTLDRANPPQYAVIFADKDPREHLDWLGGKLGAYEIVFHGEPSIIDALANRLNPKYNRRNESWVARLVEKR